jgi:hypothetical protein
MGTDLFYLVLPFVAVLALYRPIGWVICALAGWVGRVTFRPASDGVPCPKCGYDCRVFDRRQKSHRCPECGTELRWGQLT